MKQVIFQRTADELDLWKNSMRDYEKGKRTKKPFGQSIPPVDHVNYGKIKQQQTRFNPVLQTFKHHQDQSKADTKQQFNRVKSLMSHIKNVQKYQKGYDIINLHNYNDGQNRQGSLDAQGGSKKLGPIRNAYNVINNQKLPQFYFKNRDLHLPVERQKNLINYHKKQFDIITGNYKQSNQVKKQVQKTIQNQKIFQRYWKTHNYDPVFGKFYDKDRQQQYQQNLRQQEKHHGQNVDKKLPQSYIYREPLILDYEKPLPQALRTLDQKDNNKKRKYQVKYVIQQQYGQRNMQQQQKRQKVVRNRVHDGRILQQKAKEFDIITNTQHPQNRSQQLFGKKSKLNSWQQYIKPTDNLPKFIKTAGFT